MIIEHRQRPYFVALTARMRGRSLNRSYSGPLSFSLRVGQLRFLVSRSAKVTTWVILNGLRMKAA